MMNTQDPQPTILSLTTYDINTTWSTGRSDCDATELVEAFYGLMVAQTFSPQLVIDSMEEFVKNHKKI